MDTHIPAAIQPLMEEYIGSLDVQLPGLVYDIYFYSAAAVETNSEKIRDITFITMVSRNLTKEDMRKLRRVHRKLHAKYPWAHKLEGEYVPLGSLKDDPQYKESIHFEKNKFRRCGEEFFLIWYQVMEKGVCIKGPLWKGSRDMNWSFIISYLDNYLNVYWVEKEKHNFIFYLDDGVAYTVLTLCRILYTLSNHSSTSKHIAGEYIMQIISEKWYLLIQEAFRIYDKEKLDSLFLSRRQRAHITKEFIRYVRNYCNERFFCSEEKNGNLSRGVIS